MVEKPTYKKSENGAKELEADEHRDSKLAISSRENDLLDTNKILKDIQRNAEAGNWWTNLLFDTVYWSEEMFHIFGLDPQSEPPTYEENRKIIHPDDWELFDTAVNKCLSNGIDYDLEFRIFKPSGEIRYINAKGSAEKDSNGAVKRLVGMTQDITARKETENDLLDTNKILKDIQRNAEAGNWWTNLLFDTVYWSEEMFHIFGLDPQSEPPTYEENRKIIHPDDWELFDTAVNKCLSNGIDYDLEFRIFKPSGEIRYINAKGSAEKDSNGAVKRLVGMTQDITVRKEMEESLKKAHDDLEEKVRERTQELKKANESLHEKTINLEELNTALKVLLEKREKDKENDGEKILLNVKELLIPYLIKLKRGPLNENQRSYIELLESGLQDITSPFAQKITSRYMHITPGEMKVANLVKEGKTSKEIAEILNSTERAVVAHRSNLRKKLGLKKKHNLRTHLLSLQ